MVWGVGAILLGLSVIICAILMKSKQTDMDLFDKVNILGLFVGGVGFILFGVLILIGWFK